MVLFHQFDELRCHLIQQDEGLNDFREEKTCLFVVVVCRRYLAGDFKDGFFLVVFGVGVPRGFPSDAAAVIGRIYELPVLVILWHSSTPCTFRAGIWHKGDTQRQWPWLRP